MATHQINKVLLDFSFSKKEKELALQKSKQFFYEKALPVMSAGFDNIPEPVYIDKLEIDLGTTNAENFETDFLKAFRKSLEKYIALKSVLGD